MQFEGHEFEMHQETLTMDGKTHWYRCGECQEPCELIGDLTSGLSGLSKCHTAPAAYLRYGHVLPKGINLPPSMEKHA